MPGFADSFWSSDYAAGLGVLFGKLEQGVLENRQLLTISRMRAEAEEVYGQRLGDIPVAVDKIQGGFSRDDGASVRKAYEGVRTEVEDAARNHHKIAQNIRDLVVNPFSRWCDAHEARIQDCQDELQARIKTHDRQLELVKKLRNNYFNKSRLLEDLEEENKLAFQDPENSPKANIPAIKVENEVEFAEEEEPYEIGDEIYPPEQVKKIIAHMLSNIKMGETKVPILGTYLNTSAGSDIVEYLQKNMNSTSVSLAERIGQDLVSHGFLRLVGNVGNTFANSSKMFYQWRPKAFQMSGIPEKKAAMLGRTFSLTASGTDPNAVDSPVIGTVNEYLEKWNVLGTAHPNETPSDRMRREAREADERYKAGVRKLDELRCELEEAIFDHLRFLERCELDRLKAIKTVILDFSGTISNVIPSLQATVDKLVLYQETVQPLGDLRYLLENYRTGSFIPKVVTYENYYNKVDEETFGVDLEARARADKKRVPIVVTTLLTYLDNHYPDLEGDEARRNVWLIDVPLHIVHKLRAKVNHGKAFSSDVLDEFDIPTVACLLKLYLRELPDSLVSSHVYEIIRTIYQNSAGETTEDAQRIPVLQQTLSQLRLTNIATLDACMNHFTRLIDLTSADEAYVSALATTLAPCVLRPRVESSLTMEEKHAYRLVRDLFAHKEAIFSELKRLSALTHSSSINHGSRASVGGSLSGGPAGQRPRAISTDESNRKAHMEERNRAILEKASGSRSRATSPAPSPRGAGAHRRERSIGGPETRFPIQTSPTSSTERHRQSMGPILGVKRSSLEVPGASLTDSSNGDTHAPAANGTVGLESSVLPSDVMASPPADKRSSLNRSSVRFVAGRRITPSAAIASAAAAAVTGTATPQAGAAGADDTGYRRHSQQHSVTLVDRPMAD